MNVNDLVRVRIASSTVIAVLLFALPVQSFTSVFHPICPFVDAKEGAIDHIEDITSLLHCAGSIPTSTCIFNPTVLHFKDDIFLWAARSYAPKNEKLYCIASLKDQLPSVSFDRRQGRNTFILAATKTIYHGKGNASHELLGLSKIDVHLEDPRLFQDGHGTVWLLTHNPYKRTMVVASVGVKCGTEPSGNLKCSLELSDRILLNFVKRMRKEKNWVPHNGTTKMSYPVYPTFGPHKVFAWRSYARPVTKESFDRVAPVEPFFEQVHKHYGDLLHFAGSSHAILQLLRGGGPHPGAPRLLPRQDQRHRGRHLRRAGGQGGVRAAAGLLRVPLPGRLAVQAPRAGVCHVPLPVLRPAALRVHPRKPRAGAVRLLPHRHRLPLGPHAHRAPPRLPHLLRRGRPLQPSDDPVSGAGGPAAGAHPGDEGARHGLLAVHAAAVHEGVRGGNNRRGLGPPGVTEKK